MNDMTPMQRKTARDFPQELLDLYDFYAHGKITKRDFLERAAKFTVAGLTAAMLLDQLAPNYALAQQVGLADHLPQRARAQALRQRGMGGVLRRHGASL